MAPPSSATTTSVQVALRIRPSTAQDATSIPTRFQRTVVHPTSATSVSVDPSNAPGANPSQSAATAAPLKKQTFIFDQVHPPSTTQHSLFTTTALPLISRFIEGYNCTILAYGQTSSGKTYSMTGVDLDADPTDPSNGMGIIPRAVSTIFGRAKQLKDERTGAWQFSVKSSFIEIYNEDLIDLLGVEDSSGGRREVQIREDKEGHIIWGGLREVSVRNAAEVMELLRQGTSLRRTNETDMNAQSSRSHAIFSLTLTQKKYTGTGAPPRSSSPLPPNPSPSRLARPGSVYARVGSPTFGRPGTPSFASAMGKSLRPASSLGQTTRPRSPDGDDSPGQWITITSKFHFVDLAGSERLKRTAAVGERIKEGISINGGLLALGNVISALGDPLRAKTNTATHIPYRDSKLTRLLQDSLGGNAHTLMIACVSPAEWNVGETVNTLKYANRARNIRNRAEVKEHEDGWEDLEWLQNMVLKLRKELKSIKEGGGLLNSTSRPSTELEGAGKKVVEQLVTLQGSYEELRERFVERTEELTRLRRDLDDKRSSSGGAIGGTRKYEEIVGPVIEEYEKTIGAMEAELNLNRAALRHTNDMVTEKEEELSILSERHSATEAYVEELRARVGKLTEREASTESYIRDLEQKLKAFDESTMTSSSSVSDLKKELSRYRDAELHSAQHIADLELRLARSDESVLSLRASVESLEMEVDSRRAQVETLQRQLEALRHDGESWRASLEEREKTVSELETKLRGWEEKKKEVAQERVRLGSVVGDVAKARRSLEVEVAQVQAIANGNGSPNHGDSANGSIVQAQLLALQQTHTATLADLASVTSKYRDALREISDLAAQIEEAKLQSPVSDSPIESSSPAFEGSIGRRRGTLVRKEISEGQVNGSNRRFFFRQAASAESLHARSRSQSQSLSQELSSARTPKQSLTSSNGIPGSLMNSPTSFTTPPLTPKLLFPSSPGPNERSVLSLEKEIMRLQEVLNEREAEISALEESLRKQTTAPAVPNMPDEHINTATDSNVLSPRTLNQFAQIRNLVTDQPIQAEQADETGTLDRLDELMRAMAQKESQHREVIDDLNEQLATVRRQYDDLTTLSRDQAHNMSTELDGLRTQLHEAENKHGLLVQELGALRARESALLEEQRLAEEKHAQELQDLRQQHTKALQAQADEAAVNLKRSLDEHEHLRAEQEANLRAGASESAKRLNHDLAGASLALANVQHEHELSLARIRSEHQMELQQLQAETEALVARTATEHDKAISSLVSDHTEALLAKTREMDARMESIRTKHQAAFDLTRSEHAVSLQSTEAILTQKHEAIRINLEDEIRRLQAEALTVLERTKQDHAAAIEKVRSEHEDTVRRKGEEAEITLERLRENHAAELKQLQLAHEGSQTESRSAQMAVQHLMEEHSAALERRERAFELDLNTIKAEGSRALANMAAQHDEALTQLQSDHSTTCAKLQAEIARQGNESEILKEALKRSKEEQAVALAGLHDELATSLSKSKGDHLTALQHLTENHEKMVNDLKTSHHAAICELKTQHDAAISDSKRTLEAHQASAAQALLAEISKVKATYDEMLAEINSEHEANLAQSALAREKQWSSLEHSRVEALATAKAQHDLTVAELRAEILSAQAQHQAEIDELRLSRDRTLTERQTQQDAAVAEARAELAATQAQHQKVLDEYRLDRDRALANQQTQHELTVAEIQTELAASQAQYQAALDEVRLDGDQAFAKQQNQHNLALAEVRVELAEAQTLLQASLDEVRMNHDQILAEQQTRQAAEMKNLKDVHSQEVETFQTHNDALEQELSMLKTTIMDAEVKFAAELDRLQETHQAAMAEQGLTIVNLGQELTVVQRERREIANEAYRLQSDLERAFNQQAELMNHDSATRDTMAQELDRNRAALEGMQDDLRRAKDELVVLQLERTRQDTLIRDMQLQLTEAATARASPLSDQTLENSHSMSSRPTFTRINGASSKLPPISPPPSVPPPPLPTDYANTLSRSASSSQSHTDSTPPTSVIHSQYDTRLATQLEEQMRHGEEQDAMIKTLNKQLAHCEGDLQAHMDLVATLETSLSDSERNLRKARLQATELAKERDSLTGQLDALRLDLQEAKREVVSVRRSVVEEKHSLEQRLDEERKAKERARAQLDLRMEELQKRKSKYVCM